MTVSFLPEWAEVIKHGLIKNTAYYEWIRSNAEKILARDYDTLEYMIYESCLIKGGVVERDPKEMGERALLNFGHTVGHAVEKLKNFQLLHGECVAVGSIAAAAISKNKGLFPKMTSAASVKPFSHSTSRFISTD